VSIPGAPHGQPNRRVLRDIASSIRVASGVIAPY
jgi:hypothetical protein